jgi:hypothetical protein
VKRAAGRNSPRTSITIVHPAQTAVAHLGVCREKVVRQLKESLGDIFKRDLLTVIAKRGETAEPVVWAMMSDHGTSLN